MISKEVDLLENQSAGRYQWLYDEVDSLKCEINELKLDIYQDKVIEMPVINKAILRFEIDSSWVNDSMNYKWW